MLCITVEVEPRIAKQMQKKSGERGKVSLRRFLADQKIAISCKKKKKAFWASYSTSSKLLLVVRHILTTGLQKCL